MCGIAGILHFDQRPVNTEVLEAMTGVLAHRGPDAQGIYRDGNLGFGHRRLSIIDLSTGQQPMCSQDGSLVIVFNGEIYNYLELRTELKRLGCEFRSESDTEVILHAYEQWGVACQDRFNGMWAFAIWDRRKNQLFLSRDRIGEKPLHYAIFDNSLLFGSEIKGILAYGMPPVARIEMLEIYLTLGYIPAPHTFYRDIVKLRPGHYLLVREGRVSEYKYWELPQFDEADMLSRGTDVYEEFSALLDDSVRLRMRSDVPFGAFLSGGLDSASVVSLMTDHTDHPVETFTIGFDEPAFDERKLAKDVALEFHTRHHEYVVRPELFEESLERVIYHYDEPFGDSSAMPTGHVCRYAAQHVKMVLTGDGGDEVLSGYTVYQGEKFAAQYQRLPRLAQVWFPRLTELAAAPFTGDLRYRLNRVSSVCTAAASDFIPRLISKLSYIPPWVIRGLLGERQNLWSVEDFLLEVFKDCRYQDPFYKLMYFQFMVTLPDQMLTKVDRMSMAHSLETRVPFLDHRLAEFMGGVGKNIKMPGYERKHVLRKTVASRLPQSLLSAPKKGFSVPLREWFKNDGFDNQLSLLSSMSLGLRTEVIGRIVEENRQGRQDNGNFLWMLLLLRQWLQGVSAV
jgi:asparagine synthase (glutamine-hydrolysing)